MYILGHRGTGATMLNSRHKELLRRIQRCQGPENTYKAFELAFQYEVDGIEFDVIGTADNDLAVIHSQALNLHVEGASRARRNQGYVKDHTMDQLRKLNVGDGEPIISLRDVFNLASKYGSPILNIELVGENTYELAYKQAKQSGYPMDKIIFSSFDHQQLVKLRALDPEIKIGMVFSASVKAKGNHYHRAPLTFKYLDNMIPMIKPTSLHPLFKTLTPEILDYARKHSLELYVWTKREKHPENNSKILDFAKKHAEDGDIHLITDYPKQIIEALKPK